MLYFGSSKSKHDQIKGAYEWKRKLWQCCKIDKKTDSSIGRLKKQGEKLYSSIDVTELEGD